MSPTLKEGFGLTVLEAMSHGLPVVVSNVGAIPEFVDDEVNGLLFEPENQGLLSGAILKILENPRFRKQLQSNAKERSTQFETIEEQFEQFHKRIVDIIT